MRPPQSCRETNNFPGPKPVITGKAEGRTACSRSRLWDLALVATLLYCLLLHCPQVGVAFAAERSAPPQYRFGVTPWQHGQSSDDIRALYKPLLEWLGQKVGAEFIIVGAGGYGETIDLLANELIDLAAISPVPFVLAKQRNPRVAMLATELSWDFGHKKKSPSYDGFIIVRTDRNDIKGLETLRGQRLGLVRKQSTSGYVYPVAYFNRNGIEYKSYFGRVYFLGSHSRVTDAIASGSIDVGATWDYNLKQAVSKHGPIFRVVSNTGTIPNLGVAASGTVPLTMQEKIRNALVEANDTLFKGLPAAGYVVKHDSFYDPVREVIRFVSGAPRPEGKQK